MKMYVVGTDENNKVACLAAYERLDLGLNRKSGAGLEYRDIFGSYHYEPVFQSTSKAKCIRYIQTRLVRQGWEWEDRSQKVVKLDPGITKYAAVGNVAAGEMRMVAYHTGAPNVRLEHGYTRICYETTSRTECEAFIQEFEEDVKRIIEEERKWEEERERYLRAD